MAKRVGVIGGGQLAWMLASAAKTLGIELTVQTANSDDPAVAIAHHALFAPIDDAVATTHLATQTDVITFENEFVDLAALDHQDICFRPSLASLKPLLDKYQQRCFLRECNLSTPQFWALETAPSPRFPVVLKTRRHGYDGQGTFIIKNQADWETTLHMLENRPLLVEEFVPFERELAAIAARSQTGEIVVYPVVETQQTDQVCRWVIAPAAIAAETAAEIDAIARTLLDRLEAVGVFGIEFFLAANGRVLVNEIAPRTHNSGHFSLDACVTSQFEQQLRAVSELPLGSPALTSDGAVMVNLLGYETAQSDYLEKRQHLAALPNAFVHWYGKSRSRPGRKLGHVTVLLEAPSPTKLYDQAAHVVKTIEGIWYGS
ncbi:5-(carboxyamino)imidazole ribonucleotide synthase [Myxacorys almedinensis A]|uniref:N5-carboxyaminoimidazole ribonucleotide synthase n=2 Tax=Myxacorys TaxID=2056239 RepID=A0A8J8CK42_9CYAN|nr:5-(carboxyamino)imidazole ribonucleotide synthase [Myxacorys almedinensis]NDJ19503.1 5-(carboxyamino)imidazole ribonucleotide synthase [Myxacorys almedinensis A]